MSKKKGCVQVKSIIKTILSLFLFVGLFPPTVVYAADEYYEYHCGNDYELASVNDDGTFKMLACHTSFSSASTALSESDNNTVIRHPSSLSPTKIIAMNHGVAMSYPARTGEVTLTLTANQDKTGKVTYVTNHRELTNPTTATYTGNGNGRVSVTLNGFEGYVDLKNIDLIPMKYIENNIPIYLGGNDITNHNEQPFKVKLKHSYFTAEQNGNYIDLVYYWYGGYDGKENKHNIGVAPSWMVKGQKYYSWDGTTFYTDKAYTEFAGEYYNYFQFLPTRSKSIISADVYNQFLKAHGYSKKPSSNSTNLLSRDVTQLWNEGATFIDAQNKYGINALLIFSMAVLESGYGRSYYAIDRNNLFGWTAYDADPNQATSFPSIKQAIHEHMGINLRGYTDITDWRFFGSHLGNKGSGFNVKYASDPYWGMKIAAIAYEIDKTANNFDGTLTDHDYYQLAIVSEYNVSTYESADTNSRSLYKTGYGNNYQKNFTTVILNQDQSWSKVQLMNGLLENGNLITHRDNGQSTGGNVNGLIEYDYDRSVGYIETKNIKNINKEPTPGQPVVPDGITPEGDYLFDIEDLSIYGNNLQISGYGYQPGVFISNADNIEHKLILTGSDVKNEFTMTDIYKNVEHYEYSGFYIDSVDLTKLKTGEYTLSVKSTHQLYEEEITINSDKTVETKIGNITYKVFNKNGKTILSVIPQEREHKYTTNLQGVSLDESLNLHLEGFAFIQGLNNTDANTLHELIFTNLTTNEVVKTYTLKNDTGLFNLGDAYDHGFDYSYGWYKDSVNIKELPVGEYYLSLKTTVDGVSKTTRLYGTSKMGSSDRYLADNNLSYQMRMLYGFSYRVELNVSNYHLETVSKNPLPRIREGEQNLLSFKYDEAKNVIILAGSALIWNSNFDDSSEAKYTLDVINETSGVVKTYTADGSKLVNGEEAPWNNTTRLNTEFNYDNTWYYFEVPLAELENGIYSFRLKVENKEHVEYLILKDVIDSSYPLIDTESLFLDGYIDRNNKRKVMFNISFRESAAVADDAQEIIEETSVSEESNPELILEEVQETGEFNQEQEN